MCIFNQFPDQEPFVNSLSKKEKKNLHFHFIFLPAENNAGWGWKKYQGPLWHHKELISIKEIKDKQL